MNEYVACEFVCCDCVWFQTFADEHSMQTKNAQIAVDAGQVSKWMFLVDGFENIDTLGVLGVPLFERKPQPHSS